MPTRKELLEELRSNIGELSDAVQSGSTDVRASSEAIQEQAATQVRAADEIARSLKKAGGDIVAAAVVGPFVALIGNAIADRVRQINSRTDLINSILLLQTRHEVLSYDFIVERSFVEGSGREERQNLLNELLLGGIVESEETEAGERLFIDPANPQLLVYQERLNAAKSELNLPAEPISVELRR